MQDGSSDQSRALSGNERAIIEAVLARSNRPGADRLRAQLTGARVLGGKPYALELWVDTGLRAPQTPTGPLRPMAWAHDADGKPLGTISVWVTDGCLSALEYGWVTDATPTELPLVESLQFDGRCRGRDLGGASRR